MQNIDLTSLFPLQKELDAEIASKHNIDYPSTSHRRLLALLVELGEFANETRCFKYWSLKPSSPKERVLDEYADGLHFLLSLGIPLGVTSFIYDIKEEEKDPSVAILKAYEGAISLFSKYDINQYKKAFGAYLDLIHVFHFTSKEVIDAYLAKCQVNHQRQENNY